MRAVPDVVARHRRIVAAWVSNAVVDGIMPVVIVIGVLTVPAAVVRFERVMCPARASIGPTDRDSLTLEAQRPHIRRVRIIDARFNRLRSLRWRRRLSDSIRLRKNIFDLRIACLSLKSR